MMWNKKKLPVQPHLQMVELVPVNQNKVEMKTEWIFCRRTCWKCGHQFKGQLHPQIQVVIYYSVMFISFQVEMDCYQKALRLLIHFLFNYTYFRFSNSCPMTTMTIRCLVTNCVLGWIFPLISPSMCFMEVIGLFLFVCMAGFTQQFTEESKCNTRANNQTIYKHTQRMHHVFSLRAGGDEAATQQKDTSLSFI